MQEYDAPSSFRRWQQDEGDGGYTYYEYRLSDGMALRGYLMGTAGAALAAASYGRQYIVRSEVLPTGLLLVGGQDILGSYDYLSEAHKAFEGLREETRPNE